MELLSGGIRRLVLTCARGTPSAVQTVSSRVVGQTGIRAWPFGGQPPYLLN